MPVDGYESVNVPVGLLTRSKPFIGKEKPDGYRSTTEFVADAVRRRTEFLEERNGNRTEAED
jgi:hypothetical protein